MSRAKGILDVLIHAKNPLTISDIFYCLLTPVVAYNPLCIEDELFELEKEHQVERLESVQSGIILRKWKAVDQKPEQREDTKQETVVLEQNGHVVQLEDETDLDDNESEQTANQLHKILEQMKQMQTQIDRIEKTLDIMQNNQQSQN